MSHMVSAKWLLDMSRPWVANLYRRSLAKLAVWQQTKMCPLTKLNGRHCMHLAGDYSSCEKKMNDLMRQCRNSILMHCVFRQNEIVKLQRCSEKLMRCQQGRNLASIKNDFLSSITRVSELISTILNSLCIIFLHVTTDVIETYVADIIL